MFTSNVRIIFRSILKQKFSNILSILALTAGIASFIFIFFYINYEKSYDTCWKDEDLIYRVNLNKTLSDGTVSKTANNYTGLGWIMADEVPGVQYSTCLWEDKVMAFTPEHFINDALFFWGDESFFRVFNLPFIAGDAQNPFPTNQSMVISESAARQLFGNDTALGKRFKINEGWEFTVSGVFADFPENSHLKMDILGTFDQLFYYMNHFDNTTSSLRPDPSVSSSKPDASETWLWNRPSAYTYIKLYSNATPNDVKSGFDNIYKKYTSHLIASGQKSEFTMQPVSAIHTGEDFENELSVKVNNRTISSLWMVAVLILLISWVIYINFQITNSMDRAKEIGLKKVTGARSFELSIQIIVQSVLINAVGLILAFSVFFLLRKHLSSYLGMEKQIPVDFMSFLWFISVFIFGAVISGILPALILVPRKAQQLLCSQFVQKNDGFGFRRILIIFQFAASIGLIIATTVIVRQVSFMKNKDVGLSLDHTVYSYTPMSTIKKAGSVEKIISFKEEMKKQVFVKNVTLTSSIPGKKINFRSNQICPVESPDKAGTTYGLLTVDENYEQVYSPRLLAGRFFREDDNQSNHLLVINQEACKQLGYESPEAAIDRIINVSVNDYLQINNVNYRICGVVEDFHQESPRKLIEPILLVYDISWKYDVGYISVAFNQKTGKSFVSEMQKVWERFFPNDPFAIQYTSDTYQLQIKADEKLAELFSVYTTLSVLLSVIGLIGMASNTIRKRVKEIGIRKVNGAKTVEVMILLNKVFILWIFIAFIIAAPVTCYAMLRWLDCFAYKAEINSWMFVSIGILTMTSVLLIVSWQSWKAAIRNPVKALRYE